jgi:hypothetical protein
VWCACPPLSFLGVVWQTQQITRSTVLACGRPTHAVGTETASKRGMCCELHGSLSLWRDHGIDDSVHCGHARSAIFGCVCHGGGSTNTVHPRTTQSPALFPTAQPTQKGARACAHTHHHDSQASLLSKENSSARREAPHAHGHLTSTLRACWWLWRPAVSDSAQLFRLTFETADSSIILIAFPRLSSPLGIVTPGTADWR